MSDTSAPAGDLPAIVHHEVMNELGERFAAEMPALVDATIAALEAQMPESVALVGAGFLRAGVAMTNGRMADHLRGLPSASGPDVHVALAQAAGRAGLSLTAVDQAYRVGAAMAWDVVRRIARELDLPAPAALELAEQHVAYVERLAREAVTGFGTAAEAAGAALARDRQALLDALLRGSDGAGAFAAAARWPLPDRLRAAVVPAGHADALPETALVGRAGDETVALLPAAAPPVDVPALVVGPAVAAHEAGASLAQARRLAALRDAGHVPGDAPLLWDEHLPALVLHADPVAGAALAARRLAPLDGLPARHRALLLETLAAWLDHPGQPRAMARALHLHPQTVRYRVTRLRERFGDALDEPSARFELALALAVSAAA